jgi:hypothetical protein
VRYRSAAYDSVFLEGAKSVKETIKMQEFHEGSNLRLEDVEESKHIPETESIES